MSATATPSARTREPLREQLWIDFPFTKGIGGGETSGDIVLSGYASTWSLDRDNEAVAKDAFNGSLGDYLAKNPMLLWQHNPEWPLGRVTSAKTDDTGLYVTAIIPNPGTNAADWQKGAYTAVKTGVVRTFSIGGYFRREQKQGPSGPSFVIADVELFEISCVSIPANADSIYEAAVKALNHEPPRLTEKATSQMEQLLGFTELADPELVAMTDASRAARYEELGQLFKRAHGADAPPYDAWRKVTEARAKGASPVSVARVTSLLATAFYTPEDEKAGRAISEANRRKLESALKNHKQLEEHMVHSATSMREAAEFHAAAMHDIHAVLGTTPEDEPEGAGEEDEAPSSPAATSAAPGEGKQLVSDLMRLLTEAGRERFGVDAPDADDDPDEEPDRNFVFVDNVDIDAGWVVFGIWDADEADRYVQVPYLRGANGEVSLGSQETEVEPVSGYRPKWLFGSEVKAAVDATLASEGSDPPAPETPDPTPADTDQKSAT